MMQALLIFGIKRQGRAVEGESCQTNPTLQNTDSIPDTDFG